MVRFVGEPLFLFYNKCLKMSIISYFRLKISKKTIFRSCKTAFHSVFLQYQLEFCKNMESFERSKIEVYKLVDFSFLNEKECWLMQNLSFKMLIGKFKKHDMSAFSLIYDEYKRLLQFYSSKVGGEDAQQELTVFLVELLYGIDISRFEGDTSTSLARYVAVCLRNKYIEISKREQRCKSFENQFFENEGFPDNFEHLEISEAIKQLTPKQRLVIILKYIYGYSDNEIGASLNISRQAVNRLLNRALEDLRSYFGG